MSQTEQPLSITQAALYLDVSEITLKRYAREKLIPSNKQGKDLFFDLAAVENYKVMADRLNGKMH
ncbi:MAG: helix-turn-helix domain-containing protein [Saccharospirillaceae bacterium]|nr:helix-turn-helix domain-containing protein [Pseudomonadales bacterium]NRB80755.1 helix-turn-helix domain-containing protein [Saccharospirillaceae bacterium]